MCQLSKYERRPKFDPEDIDNLTTKDLEAKALQYMVYAQFVKEYDSVKDVKPKKKKVTKKLVDSDDDSDEDQDSDEGSSSEEDNGSEMLENVTFEMLKNCEYIELEESDLDDEETVNSESSFVFSSLVLCPRV